MANKIYRALETRQTFEPAGGNITFEFDSVASDAGRISNQWDRGSGSRAEDLVAIFRTQFATLPIESETVDLYIVEGWEFRDGGTPAVKEGGDLPSTDTALASALLGDVQAGGRYIGTLIVPNAPAADTEYVSLPAYFRTGARYIQFIIWNATQDALTTDAGEHELAVFAVPPEIQ